jgi:iron complex outermembrane receptor protein
MNRLITGGLLIAFADEKSSMGLVPRQQPATTTTSAAGLQEVTVTAQKRLQDIQAVPISIAAFRAEELTQLGMTEGFDLANQVPNMNIDRPAGDSVVRYLIRGVGRTSPPPATSPSCSVLDDVYRGTTLANTIDLYVCSVSRCCPGRRERAGTGYRQGTVNSPQQPRAPLTTSRPAWRPINRLAACRR